MKILSITITLFLTLSFQGCELPKNTRRNVHIASLDKILEENHLKADENIKIIDIGKPLKFLSEHMVFIRDREPLHIHAKHDLIAILQKGEGTLYCEDKKYSLKTGDSIFIPKGLKHYFVNQSSEPAVAYIVFTPPFDGKDVIPVKSFKKSTEESES